MTTHDGADAETKVEAMTWPDEIAWWRAEFARAPFGYSGRLATFARRLMLEYDAEAARAKAAEAKIRNETTFARIEIVEAFHRGLIDRKALDWLRAALNVKGG